MANNEAERLRDVYAGMSDGELESIAATAYELTEEALAALRIEVNRRHLSIEIQTAETGTVPDPHELVTVATFTDLPQATFARSLLEDAGIECFLTDENTFRINWLYTPMLGAMRLQTRASDADDAVKLLQTPPSETPEPTE